MGRPSVMLFPTCVGMNRFEGLSVVTDKTVPHMRGDEPRVSVAFELPSICSQHAWG